MPATLIIQLLYKGPLNFSTEKIHELNFICWKNGSFIQESISILLIYIMLKVKEFAFNPFQVNTFILSDDTGECVIIDPACYTQEERQSLHAYIANNKLRPVLLINTHCHIDHVLGNNYVSQVWDLKPLIHKEGLVLLERVVEQGEMFGFEVEEPVMPVDFVNDGQEISFGNQVLEVLYTPGHAAGSICLYHPGEAMVWVGDVLFKSSVGRTDLPTGDFDTLLESIQSKLFVLPDQVKVFSGHGPATTLGYEKAYNPFLK
jgi:hydroxyacylglutathione hydrolase